MAVANNRQQEMKEKPKEFIILRVGSLRPLVDRWQRQNRGVPISTLVRRALLPQLAPFAGKRYAHLIGADKGGQP